MLGVAGLPDQVRLLLGTVANSWRHAPGLSLRMGYMAQDGPVFLQQLGVLTVQSLSQVDLTVIQLAPSPAGFLGIVRHKRQIDGPLPDAHPQEARSKSRA